MIENLTQKSDSDFMSLDLIKSQQKDLVDSIFGTEPEQIPEIVLKRNYLSKDAMP